MISDIKSILTAWGAWCRSGRTQLGYKNNWDAILAAAPKPKENEDADVKIRWDLIVDEDDSFVSDKQGAKIDRIISLIAKHAPAHAECVRLKYEEDKIPKDIAQGYLTTFLYGDSGKKAGENRAREYIAHAEGLVMGMLMDDI